MRGDKRAVELTYIFVLLWFSWHLFHVFVGMSLGSIGYYMASRQNRNFHMRVCVEGDNVFLYDKTRMVGVVSVSDLSGKTPIFNAIQKFLKTSGHFNICIDGSSNVLYIYTKCAIPEYIFWLNLPPEWESFSASEIIKALDSFYRPADDINVKLISTLTYLWFCGCLCDKLFVLYRETLIVINKNGKKWFFGFDLDSFLLNALKDSKINLMINMYTHLAECSKNKAIVSFKMCSGVIFFYTPDIGVEMCGVQDNPFKRKFTRVFSSRRNTEIKTAVAADRYEKLVEIITDEERSEATKILSLQISSLFEDKFIRKNFSFFPVWI